MFTKIDINNIIHNDIFLVNIIDCETKSELPFFITFDQMHAINYFESWKIENNEFNKICKIIKLPLIIEKEPI